MNGNQQTTRIREGGVTEIDARSVRSLVNTKAGKVGHTPNSWDAGGNIWRLSGVMTDLYYDPRLSLAWIDEIYSQGRTLVRSHRLDRGRPPMAATD